MNNLEKYGAAVFVKQAMFKRYISLLGGSKGSLKNMSDELAQTAGSRKEMGQILRSIEDARNTTSSRPASDTVSAAFGIPKTIHRPGSKFHGMNIDHAKMPEFKETLRRAHQKGYGHEANLERMMKNEKLKVLIARLLTGGAGAAGAIGVNKKYGPMSLANE